MDVLFWLLVVTALGICKHIVTTIANPACRWITFNNNIWCFYSRWRSSTAASTVLPPTCFNLIEQRNPSKPNDCLNTLISCHSIHQVGGNSFTKVQVFSLLKDFLNNWLGVDALNNEHHFTVFKDVCGCDERWAGAAWSVYWLLCDVTERFGRYF